MLRPEVFAKFAFFSGEVPAGFYADAIGSLINRRFVMAEEEVRKWGSYFGRYDEPDRDCEFFEWVDLLQAVADANGTFTMIELGAGYGRWLVAADMACRQKRLASRLIGVEAEPTHFEWMKQHMRTNGLALENHTLINAPVAATRRVVLFAAGKPRESYGQAIVNNHNEGPGYEKIEMTAVTLDEILAPLPMVDHIDMDIQGAELEVVQASIGHMTRKVRRVHIGTHSREIEDALRELFAAHGWRAEWDFPCFEECDTAFGRFSFEDGVQGWRNDRLFARSLRTN